MRTVKVLFFILILGSLVFSGCLREYENVLITSVDVMSSPQEDGTKLTVTPYITNDQNADTGVLTIKVKIRDPQTNLIVAEKDTDIGYIKGKSSSYNSVSLLVKSPGEYFIEVTLFEGGKVVAQNGVPVTVKATPGPGAPADIKLTDLTLLVTRIYSDSSMAIVDVSPGIYNQGGDSKSLNIEVTVRIDAYTAYTKSDERGIVKSLDRVRGKVTFDIPRNKVYTLTVNVIENGRMVATGEVSEKIKLNEIRVNMPMTYVLIEPGKPRAESAKATAPREPGFEAIIAIVGILLIFRYIKRIKGEKP